MSQSAGCRGIQAAIDALPPSGGQVVVQAGTFVCDAMLVIDRDNVDLRGQGPSTILRLADNVNAPVLVLGQTIAVPIVTRRNIHVSDLVIDGNRTHQTFECLRGECSTANALRNNGITPRRVTDVVIERVTVHSTRSGGLVTELGTRRITVRDFTSYDNHFDGLAAYETENSIFANIYLHDNLAAGFSFDIDFDHNLVTDVVITGSRKVGIFMRDSRDNIFRGLQIRDSGEHGVFLAQVDSDASTGATGNVFTGLVVARSSGAGFRANDPSCVNNVVTASQFIGNSGGCISEAVPGLVQSSQTVCR